MKNLLLTIFLAILCSCGDSNQPDIVKFKSGEYGSKKGRFIAKFPDKPNLITQHFEVGSFGEYDQYSFQYNRANEHIYSVSYADFPSELLKSWDIEQFFDQTIKTLAGQLGNFKMSKRQVNQSQNYDKSISYTLNSPTPGAMIKAKFVKHEGRIYQILFTCRRRQPENEKIDEFINSFKIYKPKESAD